MTKNNDSIDVSVREGYAEWADIYDSEFNPLIDLETSVLDKIIPDVQGKSIVEAGCGTGRKLQILRDRGAASLVGMDLSPEMLERAKKKLGQDAEFYLHDINNEWPVESEFADIVVFSLVLEHIQDLEKPMVEAHRVLKPGGLVLISELHPAMRAEGYQASFQINENDAKRKVESYFHTVEDFQRVSDLVGFKDFCHKAWGKPGLLTVQMAKPK